MRRIGLLLVTMAVALVVASGVALAVVKEGGPGRDTLIGTNASDTLSGRGGSDRINGRAGNDVISGGAGNDEIIYGLNGGPGADAISGGPGRDGLVAGPLRESAVDTLSGGGGADFIVANNRPASMDIVTCGSGHDRVFTDRKDVVSGDCEEVYLGGLIGGLA